MPSATGLRERKKAITRDTIQREAFRLFGEKGFYATTVEEIAAAAGVSSMTFFRYFPTKEDVAMSHGHHDLFAAQIEARPADEPEICKVQNALMAGMAMVYAANREGLLLQTKLMLETPALQARMWTHEMEMQQLMARALQKGRGEGGDSFRLRVAATACLSAMTVAILVWAEEDGARELPELMDEAFSALRIELG